MKISFQINGERVEAEVPANTLLVTWLREEKGLTGTHVGCDTSQCGACTVMMDGEPIKACTLLAVQADGHEITTIEGLAGNGELHPVQKAFKKHHGLQCGFCTPGMVMTGLAIIERYGKPDEKTIREELSGNLCRCTGYQNIVKAIQDASGKIKRA